MPESTAQSANTPQPKRKFNLSTRLKIVDLLRPHWTALTLAFCAVLGVTLTDVLEPWPVKIVVDNLLQHKRLPGWIGRPVIAPLKKVHLHVNEIYPKSIPYTSVPPTMLQNLPKLPEEVAYRAVSSDLVLLDVKANLVVDYLSGVIPVEATNGQ